MRLDGLGRLQSFAKHSSVLAIAGARTSLVDRVSIRFFYRRHSLSGRPVDAVQRGESVFRIDK